MRHRLILGAGGPPALAGAQLLTPCLVFERCTQKIAEARIPVEALIDEAGFTIRPTPADVVIDCALTVSATNPVLGGQLLEDKIINCGHATAVAVITNTATGEIRCVPISLIIQEEEKAPGVLPTDQLIERLVKFEGCTVCRVRGTTVLQAVVAPLPPLPVPTPPPTRRVFVEEIALFKAAFLVEKKVIREVQQPLPPCPPPPACDG